MASDYLAAIAVIPARGGSKRLRGKALLPFRGKPMIVHTIEAALATKRFDRIIVSSDDPGILSTAEMAGVAPVERSAALSGDDVPTAPVLLDVLEREKAAGRQWDILACLYATAPLRTGEDILNVLSLIDPGTCDFAMAVSASNRPVHQALEMTDQGILLPAWPEKVDLNSQDAPSFFFGNGSTYAASVPAFLESKSLYGSGVRGYIMPQARSVDLDTEEDLALLKFYADRQ